MGVRLDDLKRLLAATLATRDDEQACPECMNLVTRYAEHVLAISSTLAEAAAKVERHLTDCGECREEFEALLAALRAMQEDEA